MDELELRLLVPGTRQRDAKVVFRWTAWMVSGEAECCKSCGRSFGRGRVEGGRDGYADGACAPMVLSVYNVTAMRCVLYQCVL